MQKTISQVNTKEQKVTIGDTTITFGNLYIEPEIGETAIKVTIDRKNGFPKNADIVVPNGKGSVTIGGKKYDFTLSGMALQKVSNTRASGRFILGLQNWNEESEKVFKCDKIKGNKLNLSISDLEYQGAITPVSNDFIELLKNVPVVTDVVKIPDVVEKDLKIGGGVLPPKGLNISMVNDESQPLVDNIGFVAGKLQISLKKGKGICSVGFINKSTGKKVEDTSSFGISMVGEYKFRVYNIKDMKELANYTPIWEERTTIETDKGEVQITFIAK